jgi:hypothetical protein
MIFYLLVIVLLAPYHCNNNNNNKHAYAGTTDLHRFTQIYTDLHTSKSHIGTHWLRHCGPI